jgi:hypothetical protein
LLASFGVGLSGENRSPVEYGFNSRRAPRGHPGRLVGVGDTGAVVVLASDTVSTPREPLRGLRLLVRWVLWVTPATFVGFTVAIVVIVALDRLDPPDAVFGVVSVLGWAGCGGVLGRAEGHVLRQALPSLSAARWTGATAAGTAVVWTAAMTPRALRAVLSGRSALFLGVVLLIVIVVVVFALGLAQWFVLRRHLPKASTWVWVSAGAWLVAMLLGATVWTISSGDESAIAILAIGAIGALVVGVAMASLTGTFLVAALSPGRVAAVDPRLERIAR